VEQEAVEKLDWVFDEDNAREQDREAELMKELTKLHAQIGQII